MCVCPLPEKHSQKAENECDCCEHLSKYSGRWSRKYWCGDGKRCFKTRFPRHLYNIQSLYHRCLTSVGFGGYDLGVDKFKFFMEVFDIPKKHWLEIYEATTNMFYADLPFLSGDKNHTAHFERDDAELVMRLCPEKKT